MIPPIRGANCFGWNDINSHVIKVNANNVDAYIQAWPDYASIIQAL
jgi:hypothetical protein